MRRITIICLVKPGHSTEIEIKIHCSGMMINKSWISILLNLPQHEGGSASDHPQVNVYTQILMNERIELQAMDTIDLLHL